jgi:hypothetical protein
MHLVPESPKFCFRACYFGYNTRAGVWIDFGFELRRIQALLALRLAA